MITAVTEQTVLTPLARQLQEMINQGVVKPVTHEYAPFPTAMITVPVYDSTSTGPYRAHPSRG